MPHNDRTDEGNSVCVRTGLRRVRPLGRTSDRQDGSASAAEGCLNQQKRCPQGLKPFVTWVVNVRAEARTLRNKILTWEGFFTARLNPCPSCRYGPGKWVTKGTGHVGNTFRPHGGADTRRNALGSDGCSGREDAVCFGVRQRRVHNGGAKPDPRHSAQDRI